MIQKLQSVLTAGLITATVMLFSVHVIAPLVPPFVGPPDLIEANTLNLPFSNALRLEHSDGMVRVRTHGLSTIEVSSKISVYYQGEYDTAIVGDFMESLVTIEQDADLLRVITEPSLRPDSIEIRVDYTIFVPEATDIEIEVSNGNVWVHDGCGQVAVKGGNADIEIRGASGTVVANTINGRIRAYDVQKDATLGTDNGSIFAYMQGGDLRATTSNGDVIAQVLSEESAVFNLSSQNGGVTVVMPEMPSAAIELTTGRGFIKTDFMLGVLDAGVLDTKRVDHTLGAGNLKLIADSLNGNIWLKKI